MKCPNCNETLLMTERNNIEIDYCPSCRGVWLDKGELDKMLEYASQKQAYGDSRDDRGGHQYNRPEQQHKYPQGNQKPYKKKSFLGDLFDFD